MKRFSVIFLLLLSTAALPDMTIEIHEPWIRHVPGNRPMAGYFVLENKGDLDRRLTGASSIAFARIHMHRTVKHDGVAAMEPVDFVAVPALERVEFAPGGYHLMMMGRQRELRVGDEVPVTLTFEDGGSQSAVFTIKPAWQE
jgi:copper(I)-binding protein